MEINKEKNFISAVVYTYNNEEVVIPFFKLLLRTLDNHFEKYEIICVNDDSHDSSVKWIEEFCDNIQHSIITVINMSYYQGVEKAMHAGVDLSIGDFVYEFDSMILDYDEDEIMNIYYKSLEGYDIVGASPNSSAKISSSLFYRFYNHYTNSDNKLVSERFRILSRRGINRVQSMAKTTPYRKSIYANCGLKYITIKYQSVSKNSNKLSHNQEKLRWNTAIDTMILFTDIGYKISFFLTGIMMLTTLFTGVYAIYVFSHSTPIAGWTTTMLVLSFSFFGIFAVLTIVIKYLSIIVNLIFNKQKYVVESIHKITR